ncbi:uncharacterized protein LOC115783104 isoform X2 [Archocentrus centrarchus]|uniref:uncharacterized protein LOC115783104 isoform X2 n=1 Tax=Archocentrus centrarchus TaxID=63155 RepID=UPI0011EA5199|nr:uncharacterized protein LOC115783104 isoform X2 [Archocentrus centrarchus]
MPKKTMKTKRGRDSSPESLQDPPKKRPCTKALPARSCSPQPSTSGSQPGRADTAHQKVNTVQPVRSCSPQPSTSGSQPGRDEVDQKELYPGWRVRRSSPEPSTSGSQLYPGWRVRRSSPEPSTSGSQHREETAQQEENITQPVRSPSPQPSTSGSQRGQEEADQEEREIQEMQESFRSGYYGVQIDIAGPRPIAVPAVYMVHPSTPVFPAISTQPPLVNYIFV